MGWWSCTIMGGDSPLDYLDDFARLAEAPFLDEEDEPQGIVFFGYDFDIAKVKKNKIALENSCKDDTKVQALGVLFLALGISISERFKNKIIKALDSDEDWDNGENDRDPERMMYVNEYRDKLKLYDNKTITHLSYEGLFEQFAKKMN